MSMKPFVGEKPDLTEQPDSFLTYRDTQRVDKLTQSTRRSLVDIRKRPNPPRGLRFASGVLQWEAPVNPQNVTHYRIYANVESNQVRQIPAGQLFLNDNLSADRVFVSAFNSASGFESIKVLLATAISGGGGGDTLEVAGTTATTTITVAAGNDGDRLAIFFTPNASSGRAIAWGPTFSAMMSTNFNSTSGKLTIFDCVFRGVTGLWYPSAYPVYQD